MSSEGSTAPADRCYREQLEEQARRAGARPIVSVDELRAEVVDSDDELTLFLNDLYGFRHAHLA